MEDLGAGEEAEPPELPHDVLADAVRQAGVALGVPRQREHVLQHRGHVLPATGGATLELQTKIREDFTITEKVPTRAYFWLKAPASAFTLKTQ